MLYISSANKTDSFTSNRALTEDRAPDGGLFLPYHLPLIEQDVLAKMCNASFGENVARILNIFFSAKLTAWDVDCCIGRTPARLIQMNHRIITAECFHNPENTYAYLERCLYTRLTGKRGEITPWAKIAIRIAVIFALFAAMPAQIRTSFDVAVPTGDFSMPIAAWYAREMGLPIRTIICCCNENGALWDLVQRGEFNTGTPLVKTGMPDLDKACPEQVESLMYQTIGFERTKDYRAVCQRKGVFHLDEDEFNKVSDGFAAAVVGQDRITGTVRSVYRSNQYFISPVTAVSYGGLQDYRARSGESRYTLIFADDAPVLFGSAVSQACGITETDLIKALRAVKE